MLAISLPGVALGHSAAVGAVSGRIASPAGEALPGVVVTLSGGNVESQLQVTGADGEFSFAGLPAGTYSLVASLPGYVDAVVDLRVEEGQTARTDIVLQLRPFSESVVVEESLPVTEIQPIESQGFEIEELDLLPLPTDRFQESFPLVPGVVRDSEGRLSFNGARPSQSILLVNGANATDPLTGEFAVELPLRAIEAVEVNTIPYSAEYGQVTAAVAKVRTRGGTDEWDVDFSNLLPKLNFRDGKIKGIRAAVPQFGVSGPLKKGKLWISQGFTYRFVRSRVYDLEAGEDERILEGFDTFTQLDWKMAEKHQLTTTFSYFPAEWDNLGLTAVTTSEATPDFNSWGWNAAISERSLLSQTLVETLFAVKSYDVAVRPKSEQTSLLTPEGLRRNYYNEIDRDSMRYEVATRLSRSFPGFHGEHVLKVGANVVQASFSGIDASRPVEIRDLDGRLLQDIRFEGSPEVRGSDLVVSGYVQDQWRPTDRLGLEAGVRYDYDRLVSSQQLAPRFAFAYALVPDGTTVLKGGWGVFYDHVFLHADSFATFQSRVETRYGDDGAATGPAVTYVPRVSEEGLDMPRGQSWNVELDHLLSSGVEVRLNYRERRGSEEMIVERIDEDLGRGSLVLSSEGKSLTRELDLTVRLSRNENELFLSYVKSRSSGDLNNFGTLYQNLRTPLLLENEVSLFELDVPHRFLMWGIWRLPSDIQIAPGVEWRSGFPYTEFETDYTPVSERNRGGRFPGFLSVDLRVTKGMRVLGRGIRVGFQIFNLGSHFNPRDVLANRGSPRFGDFLNSVDMSFSLRLSLGL
ncbi:MAG TPA: carboxypeptidase regulatory-like domain-containing protein [Vicinamibacteria bacterium]|nr:carboxypeptidase regulatory-like domain-containing protein [Vicinamibacteria bacterium]